MIRTILLLALLCGWQVCHGDNLIVQTKSGPVLGMATRTHKIWKGVPYAAPPVGDLRWQVPQPPAQWTSVYNATEFGAVCPQSSSSPPLRDQSENCLFLNVYVPISQSSNSTLLPVYLWIHGGSFLTGAGSEYDAEYLAGKDMIVVTINYRLGALGFLTHPSLTNATSQHTSGFFGIQDQRMAMMWTQANIAAFGGDPTRVTVGGESAGAISICTHLAAPRSAGLFNAAIMESGYCTIFPAETGLQTSQAIIDYLQCNTSDVLGCMKAITPAQLLVGAQATLKTIFNPTLHPYEIMMQPIALIQADSFNPVPLLAGTNLNEMALFYCGPYASINSTQYYDLLGVLLNKEIGPLVYEVYPPTSYPTPIAALIDAISDYAFKCPTKGLLNAISSSKRAPTWMYSMEHVPSFARTACYGVAHSYEIPFLFPVGFIPGNLTAAEWTLSAAMRDSWVAFVTSHAPALPTYTKLQWPQYGALNETYTTFNDQISLQTNFRESQCDFWGGGLLSTTSSPFKLSAPRQSNKITIT